jgi:tetratricopeptide (TPR) repeat protein
LANTQGRYQDAKMYASEFLRLYEPTRDRWRDTNLEFALGTACLNLGEYDQARDIFLGALALMEASGEWGKPYVVLSLGLVELGQGHLDQALRYGRESLQEAVAVPDFNVVASGLGVCARIAAQQGQAVRAARLSGAAQRSMPNSIATLGKIPLDALLPAGARGKARRAHC